jgi:hypothetical protein
MNKGIPCFEKTGMISIKGWNFKSLRGLKRNINDILMQKFFSIFLSFKSLKTRPRTSKRHVSHNNTEINFDEVIWPHLVDIIGGGDAAQHETLRQREHAQEDKVVRGPPSTKRMIRKKSEQADRKKTFLIS